MGKIRVATLGSSEDEKKHREETRKRRDQKRAVKAGITVEEVKQVKEVTPKRTKEEVKKTGTRKEKKTTVTKKARKRVRSDRYQTLRKKVDDRTYYSPA